MTDPDGRLDRLARALVEGAPIDWDTELLTTGDPCVKDQVQQLEAVDGLGRLLRGHQVPGMRLGDFKLIREVGRGGMGIVYEAWQISLGRRVALKVLPRDLELSHIAVERFGREARAAARLRHHNIVAVHAFGVEQGHHFFAMDLIDGKPLDRVISDLRRGQISPFVAQALKLGQAAAVGGSFVPCAEWFRAATCIVCGAAGALDYAHARGVIHRDIKPGNLLLDADGELRITDFGLAQVALEPRRTLSGTLLGTLAYMSPEQISGHLERVDHRTDVYSLGVVLYELLTLERPFRGDSSLGLAGEILTREPTPPSELQPAVPAVLEHVCLKALAKDIDARFESAADMLQALKCESPVTLSSRRRWRWRWTAAAAAVVAMAGLAGLFWSVAPRGAAAPLPTWNTLRLTSDPGWEGEPALSPDGTMVAYVSDRSGAADLWLVDASGGPSIRLTRDLGSERQPTWFPHGRSIAYVSDRNRQSDVWVVSRFGGDPYLLVANARTPALSPDGRRIAFSRAGPDGLARIAVAPLDDPASYRFLTHDDDGLSSHEEPAWSPDGSQLAYIDLRDVWIVPADGGAARRVTWEHQGTKRPTWSADGVFLYYAAVEHGARTLHRVAAHGGVSERLSMGGGPEGDPHVGGRGALLTYSTAHSDADLVFVDRKTARNSRVRHGGIEFAPAFSPDGRAVVFTSAREGTTDLWVLTLVGGVPVGEPRRLTHEPGTEVVPNWSPDGRWVAYGAVVGEGRDLWAVPAEGGRSVRLTDFAGMEIHPAWSPDSRRLAFAADREGGLHVWVGEWEEGQPLQRVRQLTRGDCNDQLPRWSPDGHHLVFVHGSATGTEVEILDVDTKGAEPRRVTLGAAARMALWLDDDTLAVSGRWSAPFVEVREVRLGTGTIRPLDPPLVLGDADALGFFDLAQDGDVAAYTVEERVGDVWVLVAQRGRF